VNGISISLQSATLEVQSDQKTLQEENLSMKKNDETTSKKVRDFSFEIFDG